MCILKRCFLFVLFSCLCLLPLVAEPLPQELVNQSLIIKDRLQNLKQETENLKLELSATTAQLAAASQNFALSQTERDEWMARSTNLSNSLTSINAELNSSFETITQQQVRLSQLTKIAMWLAGILAVWILLKLARILIPVFLPATKPWFDLLPRIVDIII